MAEGRISALVQGLGRYLRSGRGIWHGLRGDWTQAAHELAVAAESAPDDALVWYLLGEFRRRDGQTEQAVDAYQRVLQLRPGLDQARAALGRTLLQSERPAEALPWLTEAVDRKPDLGSGWWDLAVATAALGRYNQALSHLDRAVALGERTDALWQLRGMVLARLGRYPEAAAALKRLVLQSPHDPALLNNMAFCLAGNGRFEEALPYYLRAVALDPADSSLLLSLAACLQGLDRHAEALDYLDRLPPHPGDADRALAFTRSYLALGEPTKALGCLNKTLHLHPGRSDLLRAKADALLQAADVPRARAYFRYLLRTSPGLAEPLWGLGRCLEAEGRRDEALACYNQAIEAERRNASNPPGAAV